MATAANPYAQYLGDRDALETLAETPGRLLSLVDTLGPARMGESYAPGKWSLNSVVSHLADCELVFGYRWRQVIAEPHHVIQTFEQEAWAANYGKLDAKLALEAFCANRRWSVHWLKTLKPEQLSKELTHPERGALTLQQLLELTAGHDLNHLGQLEKVVRAKAAGY